MKTLFEKFNSLINTGLKDEDILEVVNVLENDFPQNGIKQLKENLRTFGNIAAALGKIKREYEKKTGSLFEDS
ncbi:MAG TPA: hypothetical protein VF248_02930 [Nitrososphaeraceae archaeon]|jgi:hypothetical protein